MHLNAPFEKESQLNLNNPSSCLQMKFRIAKVSFSV